MDVAASVKLCAAESDAESLLGSSGPDSADEAGGARRGPARAAWTATGALALAGVLLGAACLGGLGRARGGLGLDAVDVDVGRRRHDALSAVAAQLAGGRGEESVDLGALGAAPLQHYAQDCWAACGGAGLCAAWCGAGNACCKFGRSADPEECQRVSFWPALTYHTCAKLRAPPLPPVHVPPPVAAGVDVSRPPQTAMGYNGAAWPTMTFPGHGEMHIFAIGDWGGMDGGVVTDERPKKEYRRIIQYSGGDAPGPHVMARSRAGCKFPNLVECFNTKGKVGPDPSSSCLATCGWTEGIDDQAQFLVANQVKRRAAISKPQYVLNVGDNFYWGGIETDCGLPMGQISSVARQQFDDVFEGIYSGPGLDGKPWLSVLGNHDWGGRYFNSGWDQQIAYTWASNRWVMPAAYWSQRVEYPDQGFSADIFMIDSNVYDARDPDEDPEHNICGALHSPDTANCSAAGGPPSLSQCKEWFEKFWQRQQTWLEGKLQQSTANWKIVVTHFPCGHASNWYAGLHRRFGLDLLVTGHRHDQELWAHSPRLGGLTCIVTGGGGGITSEVSPKGHATSNSQYGFFDIAISKQQIRLELVNQEGDIVKKGTVYSRGR